ncbi:UvrD-helicase domain-containing protein, partial [uncultured Duncaniella sp.]
MIDIYKASAGSGKTFTLAREYIKFILGHKNEQGLYELNRPGSTPSGHRNVLAMTFTNKATEEMKSRIIHELAVLAGCERDWERKSP